MAKEDPDLTLYPTTGTSMFPFIRGDDEVLIKKAPLETIRSGDVVVFKSDSQASICHRVIKIEKKDGVLWFHTRGDRSNSYDAPIRQEKILGKVFAIKRNRRLIELPRQRLKSFFYKIDCFFVQYIFFIKMSLAKIILFLQKYGLYKIIFKPLLYRDIRFVILNSGDAGYKFFATKNNRIIARVDLKDYESYPRSGWWLHNLEVKILYRTFGIGERLLCDAIQFARTKGIHTLYLNVCQENSVALRFYAGFGFKVIADSATVNNESGHSYVDMRLEL